MSKEDLNNLGEENIKVGSDIDLSIDLNPEMYDKPKNYADKLGKDIKEKLESEKIDDTLPVSSEKNVNTVAVAKSDGIIAGVFDWIRCILFAISLVVICLTFIFRLVEVEGISMSDTLSTGDKVIVTELLYTPKNGDIVVISHGEQYKKPIIKRVIATAGQSIKLDYENDRIIVDGVEINEPYITGTSFSGNFGNNPIPDVIPEGKIFVMGDNRAHSLDSRSTEIGLIDVENIIGKAQFVAFPFNHFGYLY